MITGLDHANVCTADLPATRAFYVDLLGLEEGFRPDFKFDGLWLYAGGRPILHVVAEDSRRPPGGALDHVSFGVSDLDAVMDRLRAKGVDVEVREIPGGLGRQAFLHDPNGVRIELNWRPA